MPYIKKDCREAINQGGDAFGAGELNYKLTMVCNDYFHLNGKNYQAFNDIIGALEGCKLELYRRKVAPYEDIKIEENGDVYD